MRSETQTYAPGELLALAKLALYHNTEVQVTDMRPDAPVLLVEGQGWHVSLDDMGVQVDPYTVDLGEAA